MRSFAWMEYRPPQALLHGGIGFCQGVWGSLGEQTVRGLWSRIAMLCGLMHLGGI